MGLDNAGANATDAVELSWPTWTPATTEAFAVHGVVDDGAMTARVLDDEWVAFQARTLNDDAPEAARWRLVLASFDPGIVRAAADIAAAFTGERVYVGIVTKKKGTGSKAHYHLDETFNYVLKGALKVVMDGEEFIVPTGALLHIPPKVVHTAVASDDGDAVYLVCRDTTSDGSGKPTTIEV